LFHVLGPLSIVSVSGKPQHRREDGSAKPEAKMEEYLIKNIGHSGERPQQYTYLSKGKPFSPVFRTSIR